MEASLGRKAIKGTVWATLDRAGSIGLQFAVNLILANLLTPADYGIVGVLTVFLTVSTTLVEGGFASALIQRREPTQGDYSTIFYWNLTFSLLCYAVLWLMAPLVSRFMSIPQLTDVLRVLSLTIIFNALAQTSVVRLRKHLSFHIIAIVNLSSYLTAGVISVWMALEGYSYWSLVALSVIYQGMSTALYFIITRWHPSTVFSMSTLRELFGYGGYMLASALLQTACNNIQGLLIGKRFSDVQTGLYSQAYKLDQVTSYALPQVLVQVMFPLFAAIQDDTERMRNMLAMGVRVIAAIVFPTLLLLIIVAEPLIVGMYREQWGPCVPYFRILCVGGLFACLQNINFYAVAARGHSRILFHWSFYKFGMLGVLLAVGAVIGMEGILWGMVVSNLNIFLVNAILARRYVGYRLTDQLRAISGPLAAAAAAGIAVYLLPVAWGWRIPAYAAIYIALLLITRSQALTDVRRVATLLLHRK